MKMLKILRQIYFYANLFSLVSLFKRLSGRWAWFCPQLDFSSADVSSGGKSDKLSAQTRLFLSYVCKRSLRLAAQL